MSMLNEQIKKHQLTAFFTFTFLFTWLLILPVLLTGDQELYGIFALIGLFGPALLNIFISRIIEPVPIAKEKIKRRITFLVVWMIATIAFTLNIINTSKLESLFAVVIFAIIALLPAYVVSSAFSKFPGVRKSLSSIIKPKGHFGYYLFALLMAPVIKLISIPVSSLVAFGVISAPDHPGGIQLIALMLTSFLYIFLFAGGINEEVGWTGFALPRLQRLFSPFTASIILWFFWILWHIPFQIGGFWNSELESFLVAFIGTFFARFIFTWLFNKTKGGILPAMILHVSANVSFMILPNTYVSMIIEAILAIVIIIKSRMWEKLPDDSQAVFKMIRETA